MHPEPDTLKRVPLFATLTDEERDRVAAWFDVEEHDAGSRILHQGSPGTGSSCSTRAKCGSSTTAPRSDGSGPAMRSASSRSSATGAGTPTWSRSPTCACSPMFGTHFREMQTSMPSGEAGLERLVDDRLARPPASDQPA